MEDEKVFQKWSDNRNHQVDNHAKFHKNGISNTGINVIGWFDKAIATNLVLQANAAKIAVNPIALSPTPIHKLLHHDNIEFALTRSCSQPLNVIVANANEFQNVLNEIPVLLWNNNKYNIAYWDEDVSNVSKN